MSGEDADPCTSSSNYSIRSIEEEEEEERRSLNMYTFDLRDYLIKS